MNNKNDFKKNKHHICLEILRDKRQTPNRLAVLLSNCAKSF